MTRRVGRGSFSSPGGTMGTGPLFMWRLWLWPSIALPRTGAQPLLPIAVSVPTRMPTADSFVGMPFMRPTLRIHCLSMLQRHTITGGKHGGKVRAEGKGSPAAWSPQHGPAGWYVSFLARVHSCGERDACSSVHVPGCT